MEKLAKITPVVLFVLTFLIYSISHGNYDSSTYFLLQADAFLKGQLFVINPPANLTEFVRWNGLYYMVLPPFPAVILMPVVAIFGINFYQPILSWFFGAASVSLSNIVFLRLFKNYYLALWMSILFAFGTIHWYHGEVGSAWYLAQIIGVFILWLIIIECIGRQRLIILGILIGCAYLTRLPMISVVFFVIIYLDEKFVEVHENRINFHFRSILLFFIGPLLGILINGLYNYSRFGVFKDLGYDLLLAHDYWHPYGVFNIRYIPVHLKEIFTALPIFIDKPPYVIPSLYVMALWFVTPAFLFILKVPIRKKIVFASIITIILVLLPSLLKGGNGFSQFGYRYSLDCLPFLLVLVAYGLKGRVGKWGAFLIVVSILVNFWGVMMINLHNFEVNF